MVNLSAKQLFDLSGKTAVVTGSTGFFGKLFVETLLSNNARVVALGRGDKLNALVTTWKERFGGSLVDGKNIDMAHLDDYEAVLETIRRSEENLEILVNNAHPMNREAGFNHPDGSLEKTTRKHWESHLQEGLLWSTLSTQILGKRFIERKRGSIINISSMYGHVAPDLRLYEDTDFMNPAGYSVAKAGLLAFTRYTASAWGKYGIRANAILPGPFPNVEGKSENAVEKDKGFFLERLAKRTCLNRHGKIHELAGPILFLASDASSYMTGSSLIVDGGWTAT